MADTETCGPIDFILLEFPAGASLDEAANALVGLLEAGTITLYDLVIVEKSSDGTTAMVEIAPDGAFGGFLGARSGLLGPDDVDLAAEVMEPGTAAALIVYENSWAAPFVAAARRAGAEMVASVRIPAQDVLDALDELEQVG